MKPFSRKKGFLIDKITEDSFYENLLLGVTSVLKNCNFVTQIHLERCPAATVEEVSTWEATNGLLLPSDLRNFFLSTNGFSFTYKFQYDKGETDDLSCCVLGGIEINPLSQMERLVTTDTMYLTEGGIKILAPYSKIHVLAKMDDNCVVLAQFNPSKPASIWLYYKMRIFYLICEDFVTYFRMALAHLGVPGWQLAVLKATLPEWSNEMIHILAPGILENRPLVEKNELNVIDSSIFEFEDNPECDVESECDKKKPVKNKPKK
ncbi:tubulin polyglutamylase complex subunit 2-like isoform X2 [Tribolium madens]|uniref:tubulin polyglutamylase complex subunit 2-like isoform X2 n=1 Tax=Tribolium madens TaxID=41895 RepID=UPI001CF75A19|nr:tubulin polyglutamylase complex subunit 2-like isoform X2 [Tribolium madens]